MGKKLFFKNVVTTQLGRRKLTKVYNKLRLKKEEKYAQTKKPRKTYCEYDKDGLGDARFMEAYMLMLKEGYSCNKAAKKIVGVPQHTAFRQAFGNYLNYTCFFFYYYF